MKKSKQNQRDIVGALFLIFLGTTFFLQQQDLLKPNFFHSLIKFWPLLLVIAGLDMLSHSYPKTKAFIWFFIALIDFFRFNTLKKTQPPSSRLC